MNNHPPFMLQTGTLSRALEKIKVAATPDRFTQDFLAETLGMKGGNARPVIPYLKRIGFLNGDGSPTDLYKRFRNPSQSGQAAAEALRLGYKKLFDINEQAHQMTDAELSGLVVQATGLEKGSRTAQAIQGSFKTLKRLADFRDTPQEPRDLSLTLPAVPTQGVTDPEIGMNLSYTINLNLPATTDIAVFNAIFRSLRENLLRR